MRVLLLIFQSEFLLFLFLLNARANTSKTMLSNSGECRHTCHLVPISEGKLSVFYHWNNVCCGFIIYGLYYVGVTSFYDHFLKSFYHKCVLNFVEGFFCTYWDYHIILYFSLLIWCITLTDLHILKNPSIPGIKLTWSWCMIFLMCYWILARILMRTFESTFISGNGLQFSFLCCLCLVLAAGWWQPHRMSLEVFFPMQFFWKSFRRIGISFKWLIEFTCEDLALGFCFW